MAAVEDLNSRKWSNLFPEILKTINSKLHDHKSKVEFRLVCKNWGSSVDPPFVNLHPFLPINFSFSEIITLVHFRLVPTAVYLVRTKPPNKSGWWLISVEQSTPNKLRAFHPLTGKRIPYRLTQNISPNLEFVELKKGCNLRCVDGFSPVFMEKPVDFCISKVVLWRNPQGGDDYSLVRLYHRSTLELVRVPCSDNQGVYYGRGWKSTTSLKDTEGLPKATRVNDVELWKGVVWAVDSGGLLYRIDYESFKLTTVTPNGVSVTSCGSKRLVVSRNDDESEDLYLVVCNFYCDEFTIYMLDSEFEWVKVRSLDDKILFLGYQTCFFSNTGILKKIKGGSIVFPVDLYPCFTGSSSSSMPRMRVETLDDDLDEVKDYLYLGMTRYAKGISLYTLMLPGDHIAPIFWPPPLPIITSEAEKKRIPGSSSDDSISTSDAEAIQLLGFEESSVPGFEDKPHIAYGMKGMQSSGSD